jgi:hypothetical protein
MYNNLAFTKLNNFPKFAPKLAKLDLLEAKIKPNWTRSTEICFYVWEFGPG